MIEYVIMILDDNNEVVLLRCTPNERRDGLYRECIYSGLAGEEGELAEEIVEHCTLQAEADYTRHTGWTRTLPWIAPLGDEGWYLRTGALSLEPQTC